MTRRLNILGWSCAIVLLACQTAAAHDSRPLSVSIKETQERIYQLQWRAPPSVDSNHAPTLRLAACENISDAQLRGRLNGQAVFDCTGQQDSIALVIDYPLYNPSLSTLIQLEQSGGATLSQILNPSISEWTLPERLGFLEVALNYLKVGVDHIWGGTDHLLFLAGLLFIARTPRRVLVTVSAFTAAHSITIFLVALNVINLSIAAVETVIALSIVALAAEIVRNDRTTLTWRRPAIVAGAFGLIHGAGFASALGEIGLPQTARITALAFFNIGVEIGQIIIIAAVFLVAAIAFRAMKKPPTIIDTAPVRYAIVYPVGVASAYWVFDRSLSVIS